jgi:tetratricopeptide (TPR) repeat protein
MSSTVIKKPALTVILIALLLFTFLIGSPVGAQSVEDAYTRAVQQLNRQGFAGIDEALQTFKALIQKDPDFVRGYVSAADAYLLKYEFTEKKNPEWLARAKGYLDRAAMKEKQNPAIFFKRAVIQFTRDKPDEAVGDLRRAMDLAPNYLDARLLYLQYLLSLNKRAESRVFVDVSVNLFPNDPAPLRYMADVIFAGGDDEKAVELYQRVVKLVPEAPNTYMAMGKAQLNLKKYPSAIASFQKALVHSPDLADAHFSLAIAYGETGKLKEALNHLEIYVRKVPGDAAALNNLALLYEQSGEISKARLTWLKLKGASQDKTYQDRAEQHMQTLSTQAKEQEALKIPAKAIPAQGGRP